MNFISRCSTMALAATIVLASGAMAQAPAAPAPPAPPALNPAKIQQITAAMPDKAPAKPAKARKVLIYTRANGFVHSSIPYGAEAIRIMGEKTGAFTGTVSNDPEMFAPDKLKEFDAICLVSTTQDFLLEKGRENATQREEELKESLRQYVSNGGGLMGIHAATDAYYKWQEYGEMIGGWFAGHPWGAGDTVEVRVEDPGHATCSHFPTPTFSIKDEIYQFKSAPYSREKQRVLLGLDMSKTPKKNGMNRADNDYAVAWVKTYGKGRVFYCSLGHNDHVYWEPNVLKHYLAGLQYALGDLKVDTAPLPQPAVSATSEAPAAAPAAPGTWRNLFNGKDMTGWAGKDVGAVKIEEDGSFLVTKGTGDVWTTEEFGDFVLDLEYKVEKGANSGVFIRNPKPGDWYGGIEIQILDSFGKDSVGKHDAGSVYDVVPPSKNTSKAPGEWNRMVITAKGNLLKVSLNGEQVIDMNLDQWTEAGKNPDGTTNKFKTAYKDMPRKGVIELQDHGNSVWFRNVRIQAL